MAKPSVHSPALLPVHHSPDGNNCPMQPEGALVLHKAIFENDHRKIFSILGNKDLLTQKELVNLRDKHGNTALHLACMMGRSKEIVGALLDGIVVDQKNGANQTTANNRLSWSVDTKNLNRWTPFHEACSYGDREIITLLARKFEAGLGDALNDHSKLANFLDGTKNFRLVLKWEFQSWVPLISRVLPCDVCVITKHGKCIRIDTRLIDYMENLFRKRGDSYLVYSNNKWAAVNNKTRKYQYLSNSHHLGKDIEDKVDDLMSFDIIDAEFKSSEMQLTRSTSGWIWKADKVEKIGRYNAALYELTNVFLVMRKRREHLNEEDLKRNKLLYKCATHVFKSGEKPKELDAQTSRDDEEEFMAGEPAEARMAASLRRNQADANDDDDDDDLYEDCIDDGISEKSHRESLLPPAPTRVTWDQYINAPPGEHPCLGRETKCKVVKTALKASVAVSEEFPLSKKEFLDLLSIVPLKMFKKLKEFVDLKLPTGFPVRLDVPIFTFLTARITFEDFSFIEGPINETLFTIPQYYQEDNNVLPRRFNNRDNEPEL